MTATAAPSNHPVFLLAEHLDMILAAIEDLEKTEPALVPANPQRPGDAPRLAVKAYADALRRYETAAIVHTARARDLTRQLVRKDKRFAMLGGLFVGGTAALDAAVRGMLDQTANAFASGGDPVGYLRSRGVIDAEASGAVSREDLAARADFRLAGAIEIGPLGELVSTFLNTIELHFDLFPDLMEANDVAPGNTGKTGNTGELVI